MFLFEIRFLSNEVFALFNSILKYVFSELVIF